MEGSNACVRPKIPVSKSTKLLAESGILLRLKQKQNKTNARKQLHTRK